MCSRRSRLRRMIRYYIRHRKNVITARTQYELDKAKARAHILEGLMIAVDNLDEVIQLIRKSENPKAAKAGLMESFCLTEIQAQAILDMRLQRLTGLEILALRKPALLIPYPAEVSRGDQVLNAESFRSRGLSRVLDQAEMTPETLMREVVDLYRDRGSFFDAMDREQTANGIDNVIEQIYKYAKK